MPDPKRECWVLAGFEPRSGEEEKELLAVRKELGFDPRLRAEQLTASQGQKKPYTKRDAKLICQRLLGAEREREAACWLETDIETLRERGQKSGLVAYLDEIGTHLLPLFGHDNDQ